MKTLAIALFLICSYATRSAAQNDYLVTTSSAQQAPLSPEEQFIQENFPLQLLSKWTPGLKFMLIPSSRNMLLPLLSSYDDDKEIDNNLLKHKIFTFIGTEEKAKEIQGTMNYDTRFIFEYEEQKYFHTIKNMRLNEICEKNPRACINGMAYLKDVDIAKELLIGRKVYIQSESVRIDDTNSYSGFREIPIPANTEAIITAVGVGSQAYPVKVIFTDTKEHSFYLEMALSRTNSGMDINDFQAEKKMKYFSNVISFTNKKENNIEALKNKYIGETVYPKKILEAKNILSTENGQADTRIHLLRYMQLTIKDIRFTQPGTLAIVSLQDKHGSVFEVEVDLKYNVIVKNNNYIEDLFGFGDMQKRYPGISKERWEHIARGELEIDMTADECRLSIGTPIEVRFKKDTSFETWFYNGRTLDFENGRLKRFQ